MLPSALRHVRPPLPGSFLFLLPGESPLVKGSRASVAPWVELAVSPDMSPDGFTDRHSKPSLRASHTSDSTCLSGLMQGEFSEGRDCLSISSA